MLEETLRKIMKALVEVSVDTGIADDTSTVNYLDDSSKNWPPSPGGFENLIVEITEGTGEGQFAKIASNTATRLTFAAPMPVAPDATSHYRIGFFGKMAGDITVQARYPLRTLRTIASPAIDTDYFLPETGSIDLSNFIHSSWFAYAPTTATMVISACELQISLDGGTTFRKASGYEIADGDFVRDEWNSIDVPLMLAQARFRIRFGTAAPASAEIAVIRKA